MEAIYSAETSWLFHRTAQRDIMLGNRMPRRNFLWTGEKYGKFHMFTLITR
jgi:hypothetical protein